jgi:hypothetical protein
MAPRNSYRIGYVIHAAFQVGAPVASMPRTRRTPPLARAANSDQMPFNDAFIPSGYARCHANQS